jgi:FAD/FMN-containing dehydrogenase
LAACLRAIPGGAPELHLPNSPDYELYANGLRIPRLFSPAAVVFPTAPPQVQAAVLCGVAHGARPVPRSGGHSFENLGSGDGALVIDLSDMARVLRVDAARMETTVQAGIRLGNLYTALFEAGRAYGARRNLTVVSGTHPAVGLGGILAAGGYGMLSRKYGLMTEHVLSARVVDAAGRLLLADASNNAELFYALRGGGGGTYGVVVDVTLRLIDVPLITVGAVKYNSLEHALTMFDR